MTTEQREIAEALESFLNTMAVETHGLAETRSSKPSVCFTFSTATVKSGRIVVYAHNSIDVNGTSCSDYNTARKILVLTYI